MSIKHYELPTEIDGVEVKPCRAPTRALNGLWQTLIPRHSDEEGLWEFDLRTGRLLEMSTDE